jgi:hypothetical protein
LGLYCDKHGVKIIPQIDEFGVQCVIYDLANEHYSFAIHSIFKYITSHRRSPIRNSQLQANQSGYIRESVVRNSGTEFSYMDVYYNVYRSEAQVNINNITNLYSTMGSSDPVITAYNQRTLGIHTGQPLYS